MTSNAEVSAGRVRRGRQGALEESKVLHPSVGAPVSTISSHQLPVKANTRRPASYIACRGSTATTAEDLRLDAAARLDIVAIVSELTVLWYNQGSSHAEAAAPNATTTAVVLSSPLTSRHLPAHLTASLSLLLGGTVSIVLLLLLRTTEKVLCSLQDNVPSMFQVTQLVATSPRPTTGLPLGPCPAHRGLG